VRSLAALVQIVLAASAAAGPLADTSMAADTLAMSVVRSISIENGDVIPPWSPEARDPNPAVQWAYGVVNWIHIRTRPHVIRRELLFGVGDTIRARDIHESERNLRAYGFINEADISVRPVGGGVADVHVRTSDNFSLAPGMVLEGGGGSREIGAFVIETNFLGRGKRIGAAVLHKPDQTTWLGEYTDPRLFGSRWYLRGIASRTSTGREIDLETTRPFYRLATRIAGGWRLRWLDTRRRMYRSGAIVVELPREQLSGSAWFARAWGDPSDRAKATVRVAYLDVDYPGAPRVEANRTHFARDTVRLARRAVEPTVTFGFESFRAFERTRNMDDYGVVEDIRTGWSMGMTAGAGIPSEDGHYYVGGAFGTWSGRFGDNISALDGRLSVRLMDPTGGVRRKWSNLTTRAFAHHYYQGLPWQTLALSANWRGTWRADPPYQIVMGGDLGLRGYPTYEFEGSRSFLVNAEDRIFTPWRLVTLAFGFVAFADFGYVWPHEENVDLRDLRVDAGFGLRIYNTRASTARVNRLDVAFRLRGQRAFLLSFGSEQMFDLPNTRPTPTR